MRKWWLWVFHGRIVHDLDPHCVTGEMSVVVRQWHQIREKDSLLAQGQKVLQSA